VLDRGPVGAGVVGAAVGAGDVGAVVGGSGDGDGWWHDVNARLTAAAPAASIDSRDPHGPARADGACAPDMQPSVGVLPVRNLTARATSDLPIEIRVGAQRTGRPKARAIDVAVRA
jgi:hypothetical protein